MNALVCEERLRQAIQSLGPESRRQRLKTLAVTRWVERHDAILVFPELLELIVGALEELNQVAGGETASKPNNLINVCTSFDFFYSCTDEFITRVFTTAKSKAEIFGSSVTLPRGLARVNSKFLNREEIFYREHVFLSYFQ